MLQVADSSFFALATERGVMRRAGKIALIVGTIIALINHGDRMMGDGLGLRSVLKIALTYLVPYCVSTWSSVKAIQERMQSGG